MCDGIKENEQVVLDLIGYINELDLDGICSRLKTEHTFIDTPGEVRKVTCEEDARVGWERYWAVCPGYRIHVERVACGGNGVAVIGRTMGSHYPPEVEAQETVVWTAEVEDGLVAVWRIYSSAGY